MQSIRVIKRGFTHILFHSARTRTKDPCDAVCLFANIALLAPSFSLKFTAKDALKKSIESIRSHESVGHQPAGGPGYGRGGGLEERRKKS